MNPVAYLIECVKKSRFSATHIWTEPFERIRFHKERDLDRAVISPEADTTSSFIETAARVWEAQSHRRAPEACPGSRLTPGRICLNWSCPRRIRASRPGGLGWDPLLHGLLRPAMLGASCAEEYFILGMWSTCHLTCLCISLVANNYLSLMFSQHSAILSVNVDSIECVSI